MIIKRCNKCDFEVPNELDYCPNCFSRDILIFEKLHKVRCLECNTENDNDALFCKSCGSNNLEEYDYIIRKNLLTGEYSSNSINVKRKSNKEQNNGKDLESSTVETDIKQKKSFPTWLFIFIFIVCLGVLLYCSINRDAANLKNGNASDAEQNMPDVDADLSYSHKIYSYYYALTDSERVVYDYIYDGSLGILENSNTSTIFELSDDFKLSNKEFNDMDLNTVLYAFQSDYPYLAWWLYATNSQHLQGYEDSNGNYYDIDIVIEPVDYFASNISEHELDQDLVNKAHLAYVKAKSLDFTQFSSIDYKVNKYKDYILDCASYENNVVDDVLNQNYNYDTAMASNFINVFDSDLSTNVVCSGYSSAFQLLCDLNDVEDCYFIGGYMDDVAHAWNAILIDGKRYLIDITNTDDEGNLFMENIPFTSDYDVETTYGTVHYKED